jgi:trehalose 6-phosphate phosphatase
MTDAVEALLADPRTALIAVDYDGTLAPIVDRPEDARPAPGAREMLASLCRAIGTVAVVSGRGAEEVVALGDFGGLERLRVLGHYGLESWSGGVLVTPPQAPGVAIVRDRLPALLRSADPGLTIEDKGHSIAVHTRRARNPAGELGRFAAPLRELAAETGLEAVPGRFVLELRPPGVDKGSALRSLIDDAAAATVIYIGDDVGDLPAYDVVDELAGLGRISGLTVASAELIGSDAPPEVADRAGLTLAGPTAVVAWLAGIAATLG